MKLDDDAGAAARQALNHVNLPQWPVQIQGPKSEWTRRRHSPVDHPK